MTETPAGDVCGVGWGGGGRRGLDVTERALQLKWLFCFELGV